MITPAMASRVPMTVLLLVTLLCFRVISGEEEEFVLSLDNSNFSDTITKHDFLVVQFYAPWCGHCKRLAPQKAATILNCNDPPVVLAKVDADEQKNKAISREYKIKGFPTIKILRNGGKTIQDYKGPRKTDGIVAYLKKQSGPASMEIKSVADAGKLIVDNKIVVVGIFPEYSGEKFKNFTRVANNLRGDYEFSHTLDANLLPRGESSVSEPTVRLFKPFDELFVDFQDFNVDTLEKSVKEASIAVVTMFNNDPDNDPFIQKFFNSPDAKAMLFVKFSSDLFDTFKSKIHDVAKHLKGKGLIFLMLDIEASEHALKFFGLKGEQVPFIIIQTTDGKKYLKTNVKPDHIASWVKDYNVADGNVQPYIKSEPVPEVNNEPVKVVVGDTFQDMVLKSGKTVLIEFYAPWCGHCQMLAPILEEVAISYENDADVVIAKIDATANDFPRETFVVEGYPTLYFKSASGKISPPYKGNRTKEDIRNFIQKHLETITLTKDEL